MTTDGLWVEDLILPDDIRELGRHRVGHFGSIADAILACKTHDEVLALKATYLRLFEAGGLT